MICRICRNSTDNTGHTVREMEFGTREAFEYFQCPACGCLQIAEIPADMGRYYPPDYFAFDDTGRLGENRFRKFIDPRRVAAHRGENSLLGRLVSAVSKPLDYLEWIDGAGVGTHGRILDVGCGSGRLLLRMALGGFTRLTGIDPFIKTDIRYPSGVAVLKKDIIDLSREIREPFDLIMFHHSFEHMADPDGVLTAAARLLAPNGCLLIAIPVVDAYPWRRFGPDWRGIRAPRHFYLFSRKSMEILAARHGMAIHREVRTGNRSSLTESALYARGIPSNAPEKEKQIFSRKELQSFDREVAEMNRRKEGDTASFYLRPNRNAGPES
jgi:SAM-dependent methyltransferase